MATFDVEIFLYLHHALAPFLLVAAVLSAIGGGWGALLLVPLFASARHRLLARALTYVLVVNTVLVYGLKHLVARVRPCRCLPEIHALVFGTPTDYSFPSGHSAGSFAFAVFFAVLLVRSGTARAGASPAAASRLGASPAPAASRLGASRWPRLLGAGALVLLAIGVGLSRVVLGVHFPGDVLAGALLGSTVGGLGALLYLRARQPVVPNAA